MSEPKIVNRYFHFKKLLQDLGYELSYHDSAECFTVHRVWYRSFQFDNLNEVNAFICGFQECQFIKEDEEKADD